MLMCGKIATPSPERRHQRWTICQHTSTSTISEGDSEDESCREALQPRKVARWSMVIGGGGRAEIKAIPTNLYSYSSASSA